MYPIIWNFKLDLRVEWRVGELGGNEKVIKAKIN
jgi:hypothetical protein